MIRALVLVLAAAVPAATPMTIAELVRDHVALTGRRVQLRGWLTAPCYKFGCHLTDRGRAAYVSLGSSSSFDKAVAKAVGRELIVAVTVTDRCWPAPSRGQDIVVCTDRGDQVADPQLIRIL